MQDITQFKKQNDLSGEDESAEGATTPAEYNDEIDLRAEDDALIAAELEAAALEAEREAATEGDEEEEGTAAEGSEDGAPRARRRGRRGGRGRRASGGASGPLEGTFEHGEEGYGLWLDPAVQENPVYAEHWAGHRNVEVTIEEDQIVIRRTGEPD